MLSWTPHLLFKEVEESPHKAPIEYYDQVDKLMKRKNFVQACALVEESSDDSLKIRTLSLLLEEGEFEKAVQIAEMCSNPTLTVKKITTIIEKLLCRRREIDAYLGGWSRMVTPFLGYQDIDQVLSLLNREIMTPYKDHFLYHIALNLWRGGHKAKSERVIWQMSDSAQRDRVLALTLKKSCPIQIDDEPEEVSCHDSTNEP